MIFCDTDCTNAAMVYICGVDARGRRLVEQIELPLDGGLVWSDHAWREYKIVLPPTADASQCTFSVGVDDAEG
jgi:hypothetical protein